MLRLVESSCLVKPAKPTPSSGVCLSDRDQDRPKAHALIIYFYRSTVSFPLATAAETLRSSLSQALVHFYPLAGRLRLTNGGRMELDCNSKGTEFYEAESDAKLDDFKDFSPTEEVQKLIPSANYNAPLEEIPLLLVQITRFSCGGIGLGLSIARVMADGTSTFYFFSEWSRIARGYPLNIPPFLDRSLLLGRNPPVPLLDHDSFDPPPRLIGQLDDQEEREKKTTITMLHLSKTLVQKLKEMANQGRAAHARTYSRYEAVAGHLWRSTCKARQHKSNQLTKLRLPVSFRDRLSPPLPKGYFGNAILPVTATGRSGELMTKPLFYASSKIRDAIEMVTDEHVRSFIDFVKIQPDLTKFRTYNTVGSTQGAFFGNPNLQIASWLGLPLLNKDFGWGKEIYGGPGSLDFDGKGYIFPSASEDGSVDITLRLQETHMEAFKRIFYHDISKSTL